VVGFVGDVAGLAFVSVFLSPVFLSSFAGLAVGLAVVEGLGDAVTGAVAIGEAAGAGVAGLFGVALLLQPAKNAAVAAITVSRNDLLIVFPFFDRKRVLSEAARDRSWAAPAVSWLHSRMRQQPKSI